MARSLKNCAIRITVPDEATAYQVPSDVNEVVFKCVGVNKIKLWFEGDTASNYYTFDVDEAKAFKIIPGSTVYLDGVGGASAVEVICS